MLRGNRSLVTVLCITSLALLFWRIPDAGAQASPEDRLRPYLIVDVDVDGKTNLVQFYSCFLPCQGVMQMDDTEGNTMIIWLRGDPEVTGSPADRPSGEFIMVDHREKTIQVVDFREPAMVDFMFSAHAPGQYEGPTIEFTEESNPLYPMCLAGATLAAWTGEQSADPEADPSSEGEGGPGQSFCTPTIAVPRLVIANKAGWSIQRTAAAPRTFTLRDWVLGRAIEVEAEQYAFEFNYEMDMLPWLSRMSGDEEFADAPGASPQQGGPMADLKLVMRSEGTTWVAPGAPGAADVYAFYHYMTLHMYSMSVIRGDRQTANMTASAIAAMAMIAREGMPLETTTKVTIVPSMGPNAPAALDFAAFLPKNAFPSFSSTSTVRGIGRTFVDFDYELPPTIGWSYSPEKWATPGINQDGYEVTPPYNPYATESRER